MSRLLLCRQVTPPFMGGGPAVIVDNLVGSFVPLCNCLGYPDCFIVFIQDHTLYHGRAPCYRVVAPIWVPLAAGVYGCPFK